MGEDSCSNVESVDRNLEHVDNLKGSISLSFFLDGIKIAFSCILLLFSVALVTAAILPDKTLHGVHLEYLEVDPWFYFGSWSYGLQLLREAKEL